MDNAIARGATTPPLREDTIGQALSEAARRWPDQEAVVSVHQEIRWTWRDLDGHVREGALRAVGFPEVFGFDDVVVQRETETVRTGGSRALHRRAGRTG